MPQNSVAEHNSQDRYYRSPVGAVEAGTTVKLGIHLQLREPISKVLARTWCKWNGEKFIELQQNVKRHAEGRFYSAEFSMPGEGCLFWYYFIIVTASRTLYYGNNPERLGGIGESSDETPESFQITVYKPGACTPDWFKHAVMYQIFPDRFYRKGNTLVEKRGAVVHASWEDSPFYYKDVDTKDIVSYDFFGGNLAGIREKLPYLKQLGISVIYLNPIFEAESNHRYDTGDYHKIDPLLGTNGEFTALCAEGKRMGIRFILDGVFSHTGSNSRYFNRAGDYQSIGAFQSIDSPYYEWYNFHKHPYEYDSWWGFTTLPNVMETTASYMDFIIHAKDSVLHHWLKQGISGWRLDVVDELPEEFTQAFYKELKHTDPEAVLIGEVWEDASNKASYGVPREYLCGQELDSVMDYPFRQNVLDFLLFHIDAQECERRLRSLRENYPAQNLYAMMNLLGSHDVPRLLTILGEAPFYEDMPAIRQAEYRLDDDHFNLGVARVRMATLWQMTYPGVPSVYYGDEIGMQGFRDPCNRGAYNWENGDGYIRSWVEKLIALRNRHTALQTGAFIPLYSHQDVYAYARLIRNGHDVFGGEAENELFIIVLNRGKAEAEISFDVRDLSAGCFTEAFQAAEDVFIARGCFTVKVAPLQGLLYEQKKFVPHYEREAGILLHPTSLPSKYGIGDLGHEAYDFIDFMAEAGQKIWQVLPLNPVGFGYSPYQSPSAFAGNPMLISLDRLLEAGLLEPQDLKVPFVSHRESVDFEYAWNFKKKCLRRAYQNFRQSPDMQEEFEGFCHEQSFWLEDYALFRALQEERNHAAWTEWPQAVKQYDSKTIAVLRLRFSEHIGFEKFQQYIFFRQWHALHTYVRDRGIRIMGDMSMFIAQDSADVWRHQQLFKLDEEGRPRKVAGVPPDYFSATGQLWGNPQYDWQAMQEEDYAWWKQRFAHLFSLVDIVRIDHFRGFESYWEVDSLERTAVKGSWMKGPGRDFFTNIEKHLGHLPIVAEDLGVITDEVEQLRQDCGYPGMKVLQFELYFNAMRRMGFAAPENSIIYTGTHDNNTTVGWYMKDIDDAAADAIAEMLQADSEEPQEICRKLIEFAYASEARMAIIPMQDLLMQDETHRMNLPGTTGHSWKWCLKPGVLSKEHAERLRELCRKYKR